MTEKNPPEALLDEARNLIVLLLEEAATPADAQRLGELLQNHAEVRQLYIQSMHLRCMLASIMPASVGPLDEGLESIDSPADSMHDAMVLPAVQDESTPEVAATAPPATVLRRRPRLPGWAIPAGLAAMMLISASMVGWSIFFTSHLHATLADAKQAQWVSELAPPVVGKAIKPGHRTLQSGEARIDYADGTAMLITAPADFDLRSDHLTILHSGKIRAAVAIGTTGFTVETPGSRIVDLGTEFGVLVRPDTSTYIEVFRGRVQAQATSGGMPLVISHNEAALVAPDATKVQKAALETQVFGTTPDGTPITIDLADIVAGGNGTQGGRTGGIDCLTGALHLSSYGDWNLAQGKGDGKFHPVPGHPMIAGVFIPHGVNIIDPAGSTFDFGTTNNEAYYGLDAGGTLLDGKVPTLIDGKDYAEPKLGLMFIHSNKGITFDLAAIRAAYPNASIRRFSAVCQNLLNSAHPGADHDALGDVRVLVNGKVRFSRLKFAATEAAFKVDVDLTIDDRYLTIVTTDGQDGTWGDWIAFGTPHLDAVQESDHS